MPKKNRGKKDAAAGSAAAAEKQPSDATAYMTQTVEELCIRINSLQYAAKTLTVAALAAAVPEEVRAAASSRRRCPCASTGGARR